VPIPLRACRPRLTASQGGGDQDQDQQQRQRQQQQMRHHVLASHPTWPPPLGSSELTRGFLLPVIRQPPLFPADRCTHVTDRQLPFRCLKRKLGHTYPAGKHLPVGEAVAGPPLRNNDAAVPAQKPARAGCAPPRSTGHPCLCRVHDGYPAGFMIRAAASNQDGDEGVPPRSQEHVIRPGGVGK